jgi:mono/diheme cytochrome c family protein
MSRNRIRTCWTGLIAGTLSGTVLLSVQLRAVAAQEVGDVTVGQGLAERWCSSCHIVSPTQERGSANGAPTFAAIARLPSTTAMSLRVFLQTPHARMPDLHLSRDEIDDLAAFILSLK